MKKMKRNKKRKIMNNHKYINKPKKTNNLII